MKAQEVLRRYASGERNFCNANLRGANFKGQDLSGADFSGADIRSANFTNATLLNTKFAKVRGGSQRGWIIVQWFVIALLAYSSGVLTLLLVLSIGIIFSGGSSPTEWIVTSLYVAIESMRVVVVLFAIVLQGFTVQNCVTIVFCLLLAKIAVAMLTGMLGLGWVLFLDSIASLLFTIYILKQIRKNNELFSTFRLLGLMFGSMGGTSFCGANLVNSSFVEACLECSNFSNSRQHLTNLTHVCWYRASGAHLAFWGSNILQDYRVRDLLTRPEKGNKYDFTDANLRGAYLKGATLEKAILRRAILSDATLENTILEGAILTEAQAVNADFTGARLTGATLEAWNIDSTTKLKNIDCQYVFLLEAPNERGDRERRPHNPNKAFQPGDFEKFFREVLDEVQILIRNGVDPNAFRAALQNIMEQNPSITQDSVKAIEKQGKDVLVTLQVPEGTNKAKVERDWDNGYQAGLKAGRDVGLLEGAQEFKNFAALAVQRPITIHNQNRNQAMTGNDQSQTFSGDVNINANQSVVNLRDISGQVNNQIAQLSDGSAQTQLKDLLTQLQAAIETEPNLKEEEKAEALSEVREIAAAGQAPEDGPMKAAAKRAINVLKGMTVGVGAATTFVTACNGLGSP